MTFLLAKNLHALAAMIDLYTFNTPDGHKASIALEELGLAYQAHWVDVTEGEQHQDWYKRINPNETIPALVDHDGPDGKPFVVLEPGAVLLYLAEKTGQLLSKSPKQRHQALQWLFLETGHVIPLMGQLGQTRFEEETTRLLLMLDQQLASSETAWLVGEYSVADIATVPWVDTLETIDAAKNLKLESYEHVQRWREAFSQRPAVVRGRSVLPSSTKEIQPKKVRSRKTSSVRRRAVWKSLPSNSAAVQQGQRTT